MIQWIPNKKQLPEKSGKYLVTYETITGRRMVEERWFYTQYQNWTRRNHGTIIAWAPMPEPFKG